MNNLNNYKIALDKSEYYDFVLSNDYKEFNRDIDEFKLLDVDLIKDLCSNNTIEISGNTFCFHTVTGWSYNLNSSYIQLDGGFYQGVYKLYNYPVEFMPSRMRKGWTTNMLLHFPIIDVTGDINNKGFIFYIGTKSEQIYSDLTNIDVNGQMNNPLYTKNYYTIDGITPYEGYYNYTNGMPYTERIYNVNTSKRLTYLNDYKDIIDNAFGIRITHDGRIGYRTIYATDPCYTGETQNVTGITNNSFTDIINSGDFTTRKIITKYFTIEESYTSNQVISQDEEKFIFISIIFERDFSYNGDKCELKYGDYKRGTLSILLNGITVYKNKNFTEVIPHELDTESKYQEGVPFNISFGGGSHDSLWLDEPEENNKLIEKFFGGTFMGGIRKFEMYSIPLYVTEIKSIISNKFTEYNLFHINGGRRVFYKSIL